VLAESVKQMVWHMVRQILEQLDWVVDQTDVKVQSVPFSKAARYRRPDWITFHAFRNTSDPRDVVLTDRRQNAPLPTDARWAYYATFSSPLKASVAFGVRDIRQLSPACACSRLSAHAHRTDVATCVMAMLDHAHIALNDREEPVLLAWPTQGNAGGFLQSEKAVDWRAFVDSLGIDARIRDRARQVRKGADAVFAWLGGLQRPQSGRTRWLDPLELALMDRYGGSLSKNKRNFSALLKYMVDCDGLTDAQIPMVVGCGGTALGQLTGDTHPTVAERRNALAHGDPFDGLPTGGLLELVKDLINFGYHCARPCRPRRLFRERMAAPGRRPAPCTGCAHPCASAPRLDCKRRRRPLGTSMCPVTTKTRDAISVQSIRLAPG
jgi:hypothetical protein